MKPSPTQLSILRQVDTALRPDWRLRGQKPSSIRICFDRGWIASVKGRGTVVTEAGRVFLEAEKAEH